MTVAAVTVNSLHVCVYVCVPCVCLLCVSCPAAASTASFGVHGNRLARLNAGPVREYHVSSAHGGVCATWRVADETVCDEEVPL